MPTTPADWECCICNELLLDPVCLNCGHAYCKGCLVQWQATCEKAGYASLPCPSCRAPIVEPFAVCQVVKNNIEADHPVLIKQRRAEAQAKLSDVEKRLQQFIALKLCCENHTHRTTPLHHSAPLPISTMDSALASPMFTHNSPTGNSYSSYGTNRTVDRTDNANTSPLLATPPPHNQLRRSRTSQNVSNAGAGLPPLAPRRRTQTLHGSNSPVNQQLVIMTPLLNSRTAESPQSCQSVPFTPRTVSISATCIPTTSTPRMNGQARTPILLSPTANTYDVMTSSTIRNLTATIAMPDLQSPRHRALSMPWEDASLVDPEIQVNMHLLHQALSTDTVFTVVNSKGDETDAVKLVNATSSSSSPTITLPLARPVTPSVPAARPRLSTREGTISVAATHTATSTAAAPVVPFVSAMQQQVSKGDGDISTSLSSSHLQASLCRAPEVVSTPRHPMSYPNVEAVKDVTSPSITGQGQGRSLAAGSTPRAVIQQHQRRQGDGFPWPMMTNPPCLIDSLGPDIDDSSICGGSEGLAVSHDCNRQFMELQPTTCQRIDFVLNRDEHGVGDCSTSSSRFTLALQRMAAQDAAHQAAGRPCMSALRQLFTTTADPEHHPSTFLHRSVCHTELAADDDVMPAAETGQLSADVMSQQACLPTDKQLSSATSNTTTVQPTSHLLPCTPSTCLTPQPAGTSCELSTPSILRLASPLRTMRRSASSSAVDTFNAARPYPPTPRAIQPMPPSPFTCNQPEVHPLPDGGVTSAPLFPLLALPPELPETTQISEPLIRSTANQSHYERQRASYTLPLVATMEHATSRILDEDLHSTPLLQLLLSRQSMIDEPVINKAQPWHNTLADKAMRAGCSSALVALFAEHYAQQLAQYGNQNHTSVFQCVAIIEEYLYYNTPDRQQYADLFTLQDRMLQAVEQLIAADGNSAHTS